MLITGGAISGYCAIGSRVKATAPRITNTIDSTAAKIGRSMKKWEIRIGGVPYFCAVPGTGGFGAPGLRRHLDARPGAHQPVDDHAIGRLRARS